MDANSKEISQVNSRLAIIEAKQAAQEAVNQKVDELLTTNNKSLGIRELIAWAVPTLIALGAWFK